MYIDKCIPLVLITLLLFVIALPAHAGTVHKWVDAQGVTHYSDHLPENYSNSVKQIDVSNTYSSSDGSDYQQDYYSVTNQWARMREERLERKQLQLEKAKQKAAQQPFVPQVVYINQAEEDRNRNVYYPAYFPKFGHRGHAYKHRKKFGNNYSGRFNGRYNGTSCRWPRNGYSRSGGSGLTLTIR